MNIDKLIDIAKKFAKQLLEDSEEFYPFAFGKSKQGEIISVMPKLENDFPSESELIEKVKLALSISNKQNDFSTVCITRNVQITSFGNIMPEDAIQITLNYFTGITIQHYVTYSLIDSHLSYGVSWSEVGIDSIIFPIVDLTNKVFTLKRVINDATSISYVIYDEKKQWQFLDGNPVTIDDLTLVELSSILKLEPSILNILDLKEGYEAKIVLPGKEWEKFNSIN